MRIKNKYIISDKFIHICEKSKAWFAWKKINNYHGYFLRYVHNPIEQKCYSNWLCHFEMKEKKYFGDLIMYIHIVINSLRER